MNRILVTLTLVSALVSCKKDEDGDVVPIIVNSIKAGTTWGMNYDTIDPNFSLQINWDAQYLYGTGKDSIDIDQDGAFDLIFDCSLLNEDSLYLLNGQLPDPFPYFSVTPKNGYLIRQRNEIAYIGLGQTTEIPWVDTINFDAKIRMDDLWAGSKIHMWQEAPSSVLFSSGPWYNLTKKMYIGLNKLNKLGWIEVDATDRDSIVFKAMAFQL